jgi:hypothetical protein
MEEQPRPAPENGPKPAEPEKSFEELAGRPAGGSFWEFLRFVAWNKKWWLVPILVVVLLLGLIVVLSGTGAAPFLYTLF